MLLQQYGSDPSEIFSSFLSFLYRFISLESSRIQLDENNNGVGGDEDDNDDNDKITIQNTRITIH